MELEWRDKKSGREESRGREEKEGRERGDWSEQFLLCVYGWLFALYASMQTCTLLGSKQSSLQCQVGLDFEQDR